MPTPQNRERDFNLKFRSYSKDIVGYRVIIGCEIHYIINNLYVSSTSRIIDMLVLIGESYPDYGFLIMQAGDRFTFDRSYRYCRKLDEYTYETSREKIVYLTDYNLWNTFKEIEDND